MLRIPLFALRDKQAFRAVSGSLRVIGKPNELARKLQKDGAKLVHIIDLDAQKGLSTNFDVYDHLTYFVNVQVEAGTKAEFVERLLKVKARVVVGLPAAFDLAKFRKSERLLVGKINADYDGDVSGVHDLIITGATDESVERFAKTGKRIIVSGEGYGKPNTMGASPPSPPGAASRTEVRGAPGNEASFPRAHLKAENWKLVWGVLDPI